MFLDVLLSMRLSNLGQSVIDWDESPFIIVASDLLRGHLPCVGLDDNKPPGIFLAWAGGMSVFGESLPVVRHFGTFCLLVAAVVWEWVMIT